MHFIFPYAEVLKHHILEHQETSSALESLLSRLGLRRREEKRLTFIIISSQTFGGFEVMINLIEKCEAVFGEKINLTKIRFEMFRDIETAKKSPVVEVASFIYFPEYDSREVEDYPELEQILPFE